MNKPRDVVVTRQETSIGVTFTATEYSTIRVALRHLFASDADGYWDGHSSWPALALALHDDLPDDPELS